ncbi:hypothetical protein DN752_16055 [Echinicola strongylocentroti]|uniref:Uncharacterized protein n=1 Tax=Echinicola strongylocentroti TaxID=1795355 RepID=A0A2Z4ILT0_9BACT|nr:hypothetical protein [Echinicola strongylocentroti]AWW31516.1 hypothetical protein DN752_16055 [Echinicola strongylocentroti]
MQVQQISPIFQLFDQQYTLAKRLFVNLTKVFKSKKAIELEEKLIFLEIYIDLLSRVHFSEEKLKFILFGPYKPLFKSLKKALHIKLVILALDEETTKSGVQFGSYRKSLLKDKEAIFSEAYDAIMATPTKIWEELYRESFEHSRQLKPLQINTATTQLINEELGYFKFDSEKQLEAKEIKDIYEGLQLIITLENVRIVSGLNATFTELIHDHMNDLSQLLYKWYQNHLFLQHLTFSLSNTEELPSKKHQVLIQKLKSNKKKLTAKAVSQCQHLFSDILG